LVSSYLKSLVIVPGVGQGLENAAERLKHLCSMDAEFKSMWEPQIHGAVSVMLSTADAAFLTDDPLLSDSSNLSAGLQEIHRQKAKFGVLYVLNALGTVLEIARTVMVTDQKPYILKRRGITVLTAVGRAATLQEYLREFGSDGSTVVLSPNNIYRLGVTIYAVEVIRTNNYAYHAWKPVVGQVLHVKFLQGPIDTIRAAENDFQEIEMSEGPFVVTVKMGSNLLSEVTAGVVRMPDLSTVHLESGLNRYVSIVRFQLPTGYGQVIVRLEEDHIDKIKILLSHGYRPSYFEMMGEQPVHKLQYELKYHNQDPLYDSDFYINVISHEQPVYQYAIEVTIVRCVMYISDEWEAQQCKVMRLVEIGGEFTATCHCYHLSTITADFVAPVLALRIGEDFSIINTIKDNYYVAVTMLTVLVLYFGLLIWGKRKDSIDHKTRSVILMQDNFPGEIHPYIIVVWTGKRIRAGTSSKVALQIYGTGGRTRPHILRSSDRNVLSMANDDWFLLYTANYLANVKEIVMWHSSSGCRPDWFCSQITVYDLKTETAYNFVVDRWFTVTEDLESSKFWHGILTKKGAWFTDDVSNIRKLVGDHFIAGVREKHHWTSIFTRHPRSMYSRCERIAVLGTLLITTMLTSIMFLGIEEFGAPDLPFAYMTWDDVRVAIYSMLIAWVLSYITLYAFNKAKQKETEELPDLEKEILLDEKEKRLSKVKMDWITKWYITTKKNLPIKYLPVLDQKALNERISREKFNYWLMTAWIVSTIVLLCMSVVVIFYGLRKGKKRSLLWIQAFISGNMVDAFFLEPIKMLVVATMAAIIFKRGSVGDIKVQVEYDQTEKPFKDYWRRLNLMMTRTNPEYKPMPYRRLKRIYQHRKRINIIRRYLLYMLILTLMAICAYLMCLGLLMKSKYFVNHQLKEILTGSGNAERIHNSVGFNNFTVDNLLPSLHRTRWYNGRMLKRETKEPFGANATENQTKGWCEDYNHKLHGVPRIRQQRLSLNRLSTTIVSSSFKRFRRAGNLSQYFRFPLTFINLLNEDYSAYLIGWMKYEPRIHGRNVTHLWNHSKIHQTGTDFYEGETGIKYPGHGYVQRLYWTQGVSAERFNALVMNNFLNNRTRVVFAELTLYNINLNTFTSFVVLAESLPSNVYVVRHLIDTADILFIGDPITTIGVFGCLVLVVILTLYISYWVVESSRVGMISSAMTWRGFSDFACIFVGIVLVYQTFNRAVTFSSFGDKLDQLPRDEFLSLYGYLFSNFKVEFSLGSFSLLVMMTYSTAIYNLFGNRQVALVAGRIAKIVLVIVVINATMFALIPVMMKMEPVNLGYLLFPVVLKEPPHQKIRKLSIDSEVLLFVCFPLCVVLLKSALGVFIYYHEKSEDLGLKKSVLPVETFIKQFAMDLRDRTHEQHEKEVLAQLQKITKTFDLLSLVHDKKRRNKLKVEEKTRKQEAKKAKKANVKIEKMEAEIAAMRENVDPDDRKAAKNIEKKVAQLNKIIAATEAAKAKRAETIEAAKARRDAIEAQKFEQGLRKYEFLEAEKIRKAEAAEAAKLAKAEAAEAAKLAKAEAKAKKAEAAQAAKKEEAPKEEKDKKEEAAKEEKIGKSEAAETVSIKSDRKKGSRKELADGSGSAQGASGRGGPSTGAGFESEEPSSAMAAARWLYDSRKAKMAKSEGEEEAKKEAEPGRASTPGPEPAEDSGLTPEEIEARRARREARRARKEARRARREARRLRREERALLEAQEEIQPVVIEPIVSATNDTPGGPTEEPPAKRAKPKKERPLEGAQEEAKPGGPAPDVTAKSKEALEPAKREKPRRERPQEGTPAVAASTAKNKQAPEGSKQDVQGEEPPPKRSWIRREKPREDAKRETKPGGPAPAVATAKSKEAPEGSKQEVQSGPSTEEPTPKRKKPKKDRPQESAQGEGKPGERAPAGVAPIAKDKGAPEGSKQDVQGEEPPPKRSWIRREKPREDAKRETKPGGPAPAVATAKSKEAPEGSKQEVQSGPPTEEPTPKRKKPKKDRPQEGAQEEAKPGERAPAGVAPIAKDKGAPEGSKKDVRGEEPPPKRSWIRREKTLEDAKGEAKPVGPVKPTGSPKAKEAPEGTKQDVLSGPPTEEPPAKRVKPKKERPQESDQGEVKSRGAAPASVAPAISAKGKDASKQDISSGPSTDEPSVKKERPKKEGPQEGAQGETKPGGPAPAVVAAKRREAPEGSKQDVRSDQPTEDSPTKREKPIKEIPREGARGEAKPGGPAPAVVAPTITAKSKETPEGSKQDVRSGGPPEGQPARKEVPRKDKPEPSDGPAVTAVEPSKPANTKRDKPGTRTEEPPAKKSWLKRDKPQQGAQGEAKPRKPAPPVVSPTVTAKSKETPEGSKQDVRSGGPPEGQPARKEVPRKEKPPGGTEPSDGPAVTAVEPSKPANTKRDKPGTRTEEPPAKKSWLKRDKPQQGAQGEAKPRTPAPPVVPPTVTAKSKETPEGSKQDVRSGGPPEGQPARKEVPRKDKPEPSDGPAVTAVEPSKPANTKRDKPDTRTEEPPAKKSWFKKEKPGEGAQGEAKPRKPAPAGPTITAKSKETPEGSKQDVRRGGPLEGQPTRKEVPRKDKPEPSDGPAVTAVEPSKPANTKRAKPDTRSGPPTGEPPPKRSWLKTDKPQEGAQGEAKPRKPAPAGPIVTAKSKETPEGSKQDVPRRDRPPGGPKPRAGGSAVSVVTPSITSKTKEAPKGAKQDARSGSSPEDSPMRRDRKERPPGGTEPKPGVSAVEPTMSAKPKEGPKGAKQDTRGGSPIRRVKPRREMTPGPRAGGSAVSVTEPSVATKNKGVAEPTSSAKLKEAPKTAKPPSPAKNKGTPEGSNKSVRGGALLAEPSTSKYIPKKEKLPGGGQAEVKSGGSTPEEKGAPQQEKTPVKSRGFGIMGFIPRPKPNKAKQDAKALKAANAAKAKKAAQAARTQKAAEMAKAKREAAANKTQKVDDASRAKQAAQAAKTQKAADISTAKGAAKIQTGAGTSASKTQKAAETATGKRGAGANAQKPDPPKAPEAPKPKKDLGEASARSLGGGPSSDEKKKPPKTE
ncbi:hypothetical protein GE061_007885, partial [Apolygus lucorum]